MVKLEPIVDGLVPRSLDEGVVEVAGVRAKVGQCQLGITRARLHILAVCHADGD